MHSLIVMSAFTTYTAFATETNERLDFGDVAGRERARGGTSRITPSRRFGRSDEPKRPDDLGLTGGAEAGFLEPRRSDGAGAGIPANPFRVSRYRGTVQ